MGDHNEQRQRITESTSAVTFHTDTGQFRATFERNRDPTSLAVVEVIATITGRDALELTPLETVIDTSALDDLTTESDGGVRGCDSIRFRYENHQVTVRREGVIEAIPLSCS